MCLYIENAVHTETMKYRNQDIPKPLVADKDILCFKHLRKNVYHYYYTPYQLKTVEFNKNGVAELVSNVKSEKLPFTMNKSLLSLGFIITKGIHSFSFKKHPYYGTLCFKAIIPQGALYYVGNNKDLVSSKLIIFEDDDAYEKYENGKIFYVE